MYDNYNYPSGADTPDAPWNQPCNPDPMEITVRVTMCVSHQTSVSTDNYDAYQDDEWKGTSIVLHDNATDVEKYYKAQHKSVPELLGELAKYIECELASDVSRKRKDELNAMLADCKGWTVEDYNVEDYDY